ncbi:phosphoenolpyruvate carboxykinase [Acanthamoeba castellanii str. Neff]|uniref:Phosphoenolpyruvate carboxykinase n=1 Tax=Acanthamoeba castellanii (strain ATCC 30010 / Neff) TaxID=1257118 RepID=L8HKG5_ACACF|nr:phosphoenolpyruvate carboxykinase [Acanthamoeba castellanii str. Neff]ELR25700.1 phosphoenolpyruvate carboxykinase [Acanthamoeba castellanii str. Neff]
MDKLSTSPKSTPRFESQLTAHLKPFASGEVRPRLSAKEWHQVHDEELESVSLEYTGIHIHNIIRNPSVPKLYELALKHESGTAVTSTGALVCKSGKHTGRCPQDKRIVKEPTSEKDVWWGPINFPLSDHSFMINRERAIDYLNTRERLYVVDGYVGWVPEHQLKRKSPSLAADIAVMREREGKRELLMIKRGGRTFHGCLAFPGGFVEYGEEPKHAALRELQEETSLVGTDPQLVGVYGDPARFLDYEAHADFYDVEELKGQTDKMAFDHALLLHDLLEFVKKHNIDIPRA